MDSTPLLVGKGVEPGENIRKPIEITIMEEGHIKTVLLVPSTSIKGALRTIAYTLLKNMALNPNSLAYYAAKLHDEERGFNEGLWHVNGIKDLSSTDKVKLFTLIRDALHRDDVLKAIYLSLGRDFVEIDPSGKLKLTSNINSKLSTLDECLNNDDCKKLLDMVLSYHCPLCKLFGSPYFKGKLSIKSILLDEDKYAKQTRYHVAIDRKSHVKVEHALYQDYVTYIDKLNIEITVLDLEENSPEEKLLEMLLKYLETIGIQLGASKSTGYGYLVLDTKETKIKKTSYMELHELYKEKHIDEIINKLQ